MDNVGRGSLNINERQISLSVRRHLVNFGRFGRSQKLRAARMNKITLECPLVFFFCLRFSPSVVFPVGVFQSNQKLPGDKSPNGGTGECDGGTSDDALIVTALRIVCCIRGSTILRSAAAASRHFGETRLFSLATGVQHASGSLAWMKGRSSIAQSVVSITGITNSGIITDFGPYCPVAASTVLTFFGIRLLRRLFSTCCTTYASSH